MRVAQFGIDQDGSTAVVSRIQLNRGETAILRAVLWLDDKARWHFGRARCRLGGVHDVTCRGRKDHARVDA